MLIRLILLKNIIMKKEVLIIILIWKILKKLKLLKLDFLNLIRNDGFDTKNIFQIDDSNLSNYNGLDICVFQYPKRQIEPTTGYF